MNIPKYIIKPNPTYTPIYKLSRPKHCFEIVEGDFSELLFTFGKINITEGGNLEFKYDILYLPDKLELGDAVTEVVGIILTDLIERGNYEFDTK